ncbi:MAG: zinc-dependent metalloprotease, partial [Terriglobia bacterium]
LMNPSRLARLVEQEAVDGKGSYPPTEFLTDVRKGVWKELDGTGAVKIDAFRRNLQRSFVDLIDERLNRPVPALPSAPGFRTPPTTGDVRPFFRGELKTLSAAVTAALPRATDRETRLHLEDIKDQIAKVLDPKIEPPANAAPSTPSRRGADPMEEWENPNTCWPDYQVKK